MQRLLYDDNTSRVHRQALAGSFDSQATPGVTPWAGIREAGPPQNGPGLLSPPEPAQNSFISVLDPLIRRIAECCTKGIKGHCQHHPDEHPKYIMPVLCMQQQCPDCGSDNSKAHRRRWERWTGRPKRSGEAEPQPEEPLDLLAEKKESQPPSRGKVTQLPTMGYWVVELPDRLRHDVTLAWSAKGLRNFRKKVLRVLAGRHTRKGRAGGFTDRGLWAWHFFGDYHGLINGHVMNVDALKGTKYLEAFKGLLDSLSKLGCVSLVVNPGNSHGEKKLPPTLYWHPDGERLGDQSKMVAKFAKKYGFKIKGYSEIKWNPHLNVLTDSGYVDPERFEATCAALRKALGAKDAIIHYSYVSEPAQMVHRVKYVVRSTFLDAAWSPYMAAQLYKFRNMGQWGHWDGPEVWQMTTDVEANADEESIAAMLHRHECPECHGPWVWQRKIEPMSLAECQGAVPVGNTGFYRLPGKTFEPDTLAPDAAARLADLRRKTQEVRRDNYAVYQEAWMARWRGLHPGEDGFFTLADTEILRRAAMFRDYGQGEHDGQEADTEST